ncbi:LamG-like jellyroll fold domain-containing protein [Umezawaea sp. NPDC059074]|uniref:LamG domain-containing protein n=1 Tax=Umezawaea sp. NPDC059074 TaxID=3346716 RepID=UPI0036BA1FD5
MISTNSRETWPSTDCNGIPLEDPVTVAVSGSVVLFARRADTAVTDLYYDVRPTGVEMGAAGEWAGWRKLPLAEPTTGADTAPQLRVGGGSLITVGPKAATPSPADAPFRVVADDTHVSVFRSSTTGSLYVDRFVLVENPLDEREARTGGAPAQVLERAWETRYRRSGVRDLPSGPGDALGSTNMMNLPFHEPTTELPVLSGVVPGGFDVALVPTGSGKRWYVVATTTGSAEVTCLSYPRDDTGRIDVSPWSAESFTLTPRVAVQDGPIVDLAPYLGVAVSCYEEQETATMPDGTGGSLRRGVRLAIAVPVRNAAAALPGALAVYDFPVLAGGTVPELPAGTPCALLDGVLRNGAFSPTAASDGYPVPAEAVHVSGDAAVTAVLLGQPQPSGVPVLLNGSDGLLHCYFSGGTLADRSTDPDRATRFLVAQLDPTVTRATVRPTWSAPSTDGGTLPLVARRTGTTLNGLEVTIADCAGQPDLCTLTVDYGDDAGLPTETWKGVPRDVELMAAVVNGSSSGDPSDPAVRSGKTPFYDLTGTLTTARLPLVGAGRLTVASHRPDVLLTEVVVTASAAPARMDLALTYTFADGATATQTWASVPADLAGLAPVLDGVASPSTYRYLAGANDTRIHALATDAGSVLLFAATGAAITVTVSPPVDGDPTRCDITVAQGTSTSTTLPNVGRDQASVVAALRANATVKALFPHVSPDPCPGAVLDQSTSLPADLRAGSTLFDVVRPVPAGLVIAGSTAATTLQGRTLSAPPPAGSDPGRGMLALSAGGVGVPLMGERALLVNGVSTVSTPGSNGRWLSAHIPSALTVGAQGGMAVAPGGPQLAPTAGTTIEAWVNPSIGDPSPALCYRRDVGTLGLGEVDPSYYLGTVAMAALRYGSFVPKRPYAGSYVNVPAQTYLAPAVTPAFTWESWVRPDAVPAPKSASGCLLQVQDTTYPDLAQCALSLSAARVLSFGYRTGPPGKPKLATLSAPTPLPATAWTHVAITGAVDPAVPGRYTLTLYVDGVQAATVVDQLYTAATDAPFLCIGANDIRDVSVFGGLAEVRFWSSARTSVELLRTMDTSLYGTEPGLVGYWPLTPEAVDGHYSNAAVRTGHVLDGVLRLSPDQSAKPTKDGEFVNIVAAVAGTDPVVARAFMRAGRWHHLAVAHQVASGLLMNPKGIGGTRLDFGTCVDDGIDLGAQATVEAWVQMNQPSAIDRTIVARWGVKASDQAFRVAVTSDGTPVATFVLDDPNSDSTPTVTAVHPTKVVDGRPHHLAVTYAVTEDGTGCTCSATIYVDGVAGQPAKVAVDGTATVFVQSSSQPLLLGISALEKGDPIAQESRAPFQGLLTGVRFSSSAFTSAQVRAAMAAAADYDAADGVMAAWWFADQSGVTATDSVGDNDFTLSDTDAWSTFAAISRTACYSDGVPIALLAPAGAASAPGYRGAPQCTVGAALVDGAYTGFTGQVAEVRLWRTARTHDQVLDTAHRPLTGAEVDLSAYWPLDGDALDLTGNGADGTLIGSPPPAFAVSRVPVGNEGPQVRNAYAATGTDYQEEITGRPAVVEYTDSDTHSDGTPAAVMRRAYAACGPTLAVFTGYGLGEMILTYLGQVQTSPSLIGYIEGAPPVPSENLSRPLYLSPFGYNSYLDATSVQVQQTEAASFSFTSSDYRTKVKMDLEVKAGWVGEPEFSSGTGLLSVVTFKGKVKVGLHHKTNLSQADQTTDAYASGWTRLATDALGLRGAWEPEADPLNTDVGRRYQPHNTGYALVQSMTADLYAMRLKSTGAMVGKIVLPNLDIPPDRNVLMFRIRPDYVKNGTLDGKVGLVNDPDYPLADLERGSYFKPKEAYRLADRIEKADQRARTYYDQFDAVGLGETGPGAPSLADASDRQFYGGDGVPTRGIANRYVWTAAGGLHTETENFSTTHEVSSTGLYNLTWALGPTVDAEMSVPFGAYGNVDLMFGQEIKVQVAKKETDSYLLNLAVTNNCDPMLQSYDARANGGAGAYTDEPCPGKVDAYRFMSFYLPPSADHGAAFLTDVVDQEWLRFSSEPNAVALRNLRGGSVPWRVLHRVTYVSRVPPTFDTNPAQTVAPTPELTIDVEDNALLVALVAQALGSAPVTGATIGAAVAEVLAPTDPSVDPVLGRYVPWWTELVRRARKDPPDPDAAAVVDDLLIATVQYFQSGYAAGSLPVEA